MAPTDLGIAWRFVIALVQRHLGDARGKTVLKLDLWNEAVNTRLLQWMVGDVSAVTTDRARRNFAREGRGGHFLQADIRGLPRRLGYLVAVVARR